LVKDDIPTNEQTPRGILFTLVCSLCLGVFTFGGCSDDGPTEPNNNGNTPVDQTELLEYINGISPYPDPPPEFRDPVGAPLDTTKSGSNGIEICTKQEYAMGTNLDEIVVFHPNTSSLWPGAIVQGKDLTDGILSGVNVARAPVTVGCPDLPAMPAEDLSETVSAPDQFKVNGAINTIVEKFIDAGHTLPAAVDFEMKEVTSFEQAMLDIGISASWATGDFTNDFSYSKTSEKHTVFIKFIQKYFTASVTTPSSPISVFANTVAKSQLENYTGNGNPLCYVSDVTYGRIGLLSITSTKDSTEIKNAMDAAMESLKGSGDISIDFAMLQLIMQSEIKLKIIGGKPTSGVINLTNPVAGLIEWIGDGMDMNSQSRGAPISYTVKHLKDNSLARFQYTTDFAIETCEWAAQEVIVKIDKMVCRDEEGGTCPALECAYDFDVQVPLVGGGTKTTGIADGYRGDFDKGETSTIDKSAKIYVPTHKDGKFRIKLGMTEKDDDKWQCSSDSDASMTNYTNWFEWQTDWYPWTSGSYSSSTYCTGGGGQVQVYWTVTIVP
jgi:hypothetical protein